MAASLSGKAILITGASRGIGAAAARHAAGQGAKVVLHASAPSTAAEAISSELALPESAFIFEDLSSNDAGFRVAAKAIDYAGRLDAVVNNAGMFTASPLSGDVEDWKDGWATTMAVNVQAPADICRAAIDHFRENEGGIIVNIASRAGHRGDGVENACYAASKGAVLAMTKTWARGLAGEDILLYAIAPGWVETRMAPQDIKARELAVEEIPLGRVAQPEEVAELISFLASGACPSATGATFDINGASYVR